MDNNLCICGGFCSIFTDKVNVQLLSERRQVETLLPDTGVLNGWAIFDCPLAKLVLKLLQPTGSPRENGQRKIRFQRTDTENRPKNDVRTLTLHVDGAKHCYLRVYTTPDDPSARYILGRPVDPDPVSAENLAIHSVMLKECEERHAKCLHRRPVLPTRVLDLGQADPKLHVSHSERHAYVTLSYCWGGPQPFSTRAESLNSYLERIPTKALPQTIKDAILITKKLGFRYLWVDSLCIIQDSDEDKAREIRQMAQIFKNSSLTLSAASASDCNQGFLSVSQDLQERQWSATQLPYRCPDGVIGNIYINITSWLNTSKAPIDCRAWTYQETLLSPRAISYYSDGFEWKCPSARYSNDGLKAEQMKTINKIGFHIHNRHTSLPLILLSTEEDYQPLPEKTIEDLYKLWPTIVSEYSFGRLSLLNDKLPAIGGIASEFQRLLGDVYLAGLWKNRLIEELMWFVAVPLYEGQSQPSCYRAPSWSWAAVEGMVGFHPIKAHLTMVRIEHCDVTPASSLNPFGEVRSGSLALRGPLLRLSVKEAEDNFNRKGKKAVSAVGTLLPDRVGEPFDGVLDVDSRHGPGQRYIWLLQIASARDEIESSHSAGLVLAKTTGNDFKRIGYFTVDSNSSTDSGLYQQHLQRWKSTYSYTTQTVAIT